jgi:sulfide:quinone oxidoreductase
MAPIVAERDGIDEPSDTAIPFPAADGDASTRLCRVLILGGGVAGLTAAYELRRRLGSRAAITVISDRSQFVLPQGLLSVPFDALPNMTGFAVEPALKRRGIAFVKASIKRIEPARREVITDGQTIPYHFLLIATGPEIDSDAMPGAGGDGSNAYFIHTEGMALATAEALETYLRKPGPAVIGLAPGASYLSAAYEFVLLLDYALRRRGTRQQATLTFVTPESHLGHLGLGYANARRYFIRMFAHHGIHSLVGTSITRVEADRVILDNGMELPSAFTIIVPAFRGTAGIWKTANLTNARGFVPVDEGYRHRQYEEIYAVGMAARPASTESTLVGMPKTGYLTASMARAAARSIAAAVTRTVPIDRALPRLADIRIIDGGDRGLALICFGRKRALRLAIPLPGGLAHRLKGRLRRYVLWKLRTGRVNLP